MAEPICIDLRKRYARRYKITWDQAYDPRGVPRNKLDPWYAQIPCRGGITIYPVGGDDLAVECDYHRYLAKRLAAIPGVVCTQDGDHEKTFRFAAELFDQVAAVVQPHRRRQLTEARRQALRERAAQMNAARVRG
jgi:hypothetical protein